MKTLTTTAIILTLSFSGSAFAGNEYWPENDIGVGEYLIGSDQASTSSNSVRVRSQPEVGSSRDQGGLTIHEDYFTWYYGVNDERLNSK